MVGSVSKYQKYAEYKDSGVAWLGEIPSDWDLVPTKCLFKIVNGSTPKSGVEEYWDGNITWITPSDLSKISTFEISASGRSITDKGLNSCGTSIVPAESIILSCRAPIGSLAITTKDACTNQGCKSLVLKNNISNKFVFYFFSVSIEQLNILGRGTTFLELSSDELGNFPIPSPDFKETIKIAAFLDHETAKIDSLIEKQQNLIALLKEKRQAVISHAVTKGLNPNAPMKDSGVEWLGEVPEHWAKIKLKFIVKSIIDAEHKTAPYFEDGEYLVCRTTNVRNGQLKLEGGKYTNLEIYNEWTQRAIPEIGDILFTREAPAGEACIYDGSIPLCLGQRMVLFKLNHFKVSPEFVLYSIYSGLADDFVKQLSQGSTVSHFNMSDIQNMPLFEPPQHEQIQIISYLKLTTGRYDESIAKAESAISLMQERRTALISAAVTGKIDVRDWQAPAQTKPNLECSA